MKIINSKSAVFLLCGALFGLFSLSSCSDNPSSDNTVAIEQANYGVWVKIKTDKEYDYLLTMDDLMEQRVISPKKNGLDLTGDYYGSFYCDVKDGNYYFPDGTSIRKKTVKNNEFIQLDNCLITDDGEWGILFTKTYWNNYLNFISWTNNYDEKENVITKKLHLIDTSDMTVKPSNYLKFPLPDFKVMNPDNPGQEQPNKDLFISPTSFTIMGNRAYVGYRYYSYNPWRAIGDKAYMLICDYPSLENTTIISKEGIGPMSGEWYCAPSSFVDSKGDFYVSTAIQATKENNLNWDKYALLRIKKGTGEFDPSYEFNLASINLKQDSGDDNFTYIKNGKALMGSYIIDVWNKTIVRDLNEEGLGHIQRGTVSLVEDGILYSIIKTEDSRWFIAKYDVDTNTLTRGIEIDGGVNFVVRIDRLTK